MGGVEGSAAHLRLAELAQHRVDGVERCVDLFADLRMEDQRTVGWTS